MLPSLPPAGIPPVAASNTNGIGSVVEAIQDSDRTQVARAPIDPWRLQQTLFEPAQRARDESLFALANGSLGVRGGFEEDESPSDGTFLAAVYEKNPIHYH